MARIKKGFSSGFSLLGRKGKILLFLGMFVFASGSGAFLKGRVVTVHDGDTLTIFDNDLAFTKVRLYGVDCPEFKQRGGREATAATHSLVFMEEVELLTMDKDRYGRDIVVVRMPGGKVLNQELVQQGHAWVYTNYCKQPQCLQWKRDEQNARKNRLGLWKDSNPTPPWRWREQRR